MIKRNMGIAGISFLMIALLLSGCTHSFNAAHWSGRTQIRPLAGKRALLERLAVQHVQVVEQGDHLRIILPANDFFDIEQSTLWVCKEPTLELIAKLALLYGNVPVYVQGFSSNIESEGENLKRTAQQANDVAAVLWSYGVDQRRIHVQGYGSLFPIASNRTAEGRWMNHRVEVNF